MITAVRCIEGETIEITEFFLLDSGDPLMPEEGGLGPIVKVVESDGSLISESIAVVGEEVGSWSTTVSIPFFNLDDEVTVFAEWTFVDDLGIKTKLRQQVIVEPVSVNRPTDPVVCIPDSDDPNAVEYYSLCVPVQYREGMNIEIKLYLHNLLLSVKRLDSEGVSIVRTASNFIELSIPVQGFPERLEPHSLVVRVQRNSTAGYDTYQYKLWAITPQIMVAASLVRDYIDKARLKNVIPELEYTEADMCSYLYRGLQLFNQKGPRITDFTGTNMQGTLLDPWVTCSCYYALAAQLQAEGAMAFDFSGQTVSVNMDRSPAIESALGRVESLISDQVMATKKLLGRAGIYIGDGSVGGKFISGAKQMGVIGVTFSPTTKWGSGIGNAMRSWHRSHYGIR